MAGGLVSDALGAVRNGFLPILPGGLCHCLCRHAKTCLFTFGQVKPGHSLSDQKTCQGFSYTAAKPHIDQRRSRHTHSIFTPQTFGTKLTVQTRHHGGASDSGQQACFQGFPLTFFSTRLLIQSPSPPVFFNCAAKHQVGPSQVSQLLQLARLLTPFDRLATPTAIHVFGTRCSKQLP